MRMIAKTTWSVEDAREYIQARVKVDERGCWIWQRGLNSAGYGLGYAPLPTCPRRRARTSHRLAYEAFTAPIPIDLCVLHRCDNPPCCNPEHMFIGTQADNIADMYAKGRESRGESHSLTQRGENCGTAKLTEADVLDVLRRLAAGDRQVDIADDLGVVQTTISRIAMGDTWRHVTLE